MKHFFCHFAVVIERAVKHNETEAFVEKFSKKMYLRKVLSGHNDAEQLRLVGKALTALWLEILAGADLEPWLAARMDPQVGQTVMSVMLTYLKEQEAGKAERNSKVTRVNPGQRTSALCI